MNATTFLQETDPFTFPIPIPIFQILFKTSATIYFSEQEILKNLYDIMCACEFLSAKCDATAFYKWFVKIPIGISDGITCVLGSSSSLSFYRFLFWIIHNLSWIKVIVCFRTILRLLSIPDRLYIFIFKQRLFNAKLWLYTQVRRVTTITNQVHLVVFLNKNVT